MSVLTKLLVSCARMRTRLFLNLVIFFYHYDFNHGCKWKYCSLCYFSAWMNFITKRLFSPDNTQLSFKLYTPGKERMHFSDAKSFSYASPQAAVQWKMLQFKILSSKSKSIRDRCIQASNILRLLLPDSTQPAPPSFPGPCQPESVELCQSPFHDPNGLPGQ